MPTVEQIAQAICCPNGACLHKEGCCLTRKDRAFSVMLWESAEAVEKLYKKEKPHFLMTEPLP